MSKNIFDRHAEEWEDYFQAYDKTRNQLEADEQLIRKQFGMNDKDLPAELHDMIDRNRKEWVKQWGAKGTIRQAISERHNGEIRESYQNGFPEIVPVAMPEPQPVSKNIVPEIPPYTEEEMNHIYAEQRDAAAKQLEGELNSIEEAYKEWGEPVPEATKKRMAMRAMAFKQQWDGTDPDIPLGEVKVLSEKDHQNHFQSFRDLAKSHNIIEAHYGHPDKVPYSTNKELAQEMHKFHDEIDTYQAERKQQQADFKARLENMREQSHTSTHRRK